MRQVLVAGTALVLLAGVACGDDDEPTTPSGQATGAPVTLTGTVNDHGTKDAGSATEVEVELDDFYIGPTFVKARPSTTLAVKLKNEGEVAHTFTVDGLVDVTVQPGTTGDASVTLPAAGAVRFYCRFHAGQGMQGAFYFNAGDTVAPPASGTGSAPAGDGDGAYGQ